MPRLHLVQLYLGILVLTVDVDTQHHQRRNYQRECDQQRKQLAVFLHIHEDAPWRAGAEAEGFGGAAGAVLRPPNEDLPEVGAAVAGFACAGRACGAGEPTRAPTGAGIVTSADLAAASDAGATGELTPAGKSAAEAEDEGADAAPPGETAGDEVTPDAANAGSLATDTGLASLVL